MEPNQETIICPFCSEETTLDSVRTHIDGTERHYWECKNCNVSIMKRNA